MQLPELDTQLSAILVVKFLGVWTVCYTGVSRLHDAIFARIF